MKRIEAFGLYHVRPTAGPTPTVAENDCFRLNYCTTRMTAMIALVKAKPFAPTVPCKLLSRCTLNPAPAVWRGNYCSQSSALSFLVSVLLQPPHFYSPSWGQCQFQASIMDPWRAPFQVRAVNPHTVNLSKIALTAEQRTGQMFYYLLILFFFLDVCIVV